MMRLRKEFPVSFAATVVAVTTLVSIAGAQPIPPEFQINSIVTSSQGEPSIAMDGAGHFVVVWQSAHVPGYAVFGRTFNAGATTAPPDSQLSSTAGSTSPAAAIGGVRYAVVWDTNAPTPDSNGQLFELPAVEIGSELTVAGDSPEVAMHPTGSFVVVHERRENEFTFDRDVHGNRYDELGNPIGLEFTINSTTAGSQYGPAVAMDDNGDFVVAWSSDDQDGAGVFARRFNALGAPVGSEFQVNTYTASHQDRPDVAMAGTGEFAIVWESDGQDGSSDGIYARWYAANGDAATGEFQVNQYTLDMQNDAACAIDGLGNLIVSWTSEAQDGDVSGIFARRFGPTGTPSGDEFQVNLQTVLYQIDSDVAADAEGNVTIVWQSMVGDGDTWGIFGRHFDFGTASSTSEPRGTPMLLSQNTPNPFNPSTSIRYSLHAAGPVELMVYDVHGRHVTTLVSAMRPAGVNQATWNGRNAAGEAMGSGVYFYRLRFDGETQTRKMVLLK